MSKYRWINDDVKIDFPVSKLLQNTMEEAEAADRADNLEYWAIADGIDVICKAYFTGGHMTKAQWDIIMQRYPDIQSSEG